MSRLGVIILSYNTKKLTLECIESIKESAPNLSYEIILVDNASTDQTIREVTKKYPDVNIVKSRSNLGFSGGNNLALKKYLKEFDYFLLLNSDTLVKPDSLEKLVKKAKDKGYSILSPKLINPDGSLQPNAGNLPKPFPLFIWLSGLDDIFRKVIYLPSYQERNVSKYYGTKEVGWVSGTAMLIDKSLLKKVGYLDEKIFMYGEDVDYCWRAQEKGECVGWTDESKIIHLGGASSTNPKYSQWIGEFRGILYLYKKYYGPFATGILKVMIYTFVCIRVLAFFIVGKVGHSKAYAKILKDI